MASDLTFKFEFEDTSEAGGESAVGGPGPGAAREAAHPEEGLGPAVTMAAAAAVALWEERTPASAARRTREGSGSAELGGLASFTAKVTAVNQALEIARKAYHAVVGTIKALDASLKQMAHDLAPFSGALAASQARQEALQIMQNVRRGRRMGGDLSEFTEARGRMSRAFTELKDRIMEPILRVVTPLLEKAADAMEWVAETVESIEKTGGAILEALNPLSWLPDLGGQAERKNLRDEFLEGRGDMMAKFDNLPTIEDRVLAGRAMGGEIHFPGNRLPL